jgi:hypothetical protein
MAYTYTAGPYNSTPFSSCCGTASMDGSGRPDDHCHRCGNPMTHHNSGLPRCKPGHCLMCGKPYKGGPHEDGACHC